MMHRAPGSGRRSLAHLDRRQFIHSTLGAGLALQHGLSGTAWAEDLQPKRGGHLRIGMPEGGTTDVLDHGLLNNGFLVLLAYGCLGNTLVGIDAQSNLTPEIASSWDVSANLLEWSFEIGVGISFHNGKTVAAEDVIATMNNHRSEDSKSAAKPLFDGVEEIAADGSRVVFRLKAPNADFPYYLSDYHLSIMPSIDGVAVFDGVGTGPFKLERFEPGVKAGVIRNPDYFKSRMPYFDSVELILLTDSTARHNAFVTGDIDVLNRCDLNIVEQLAGLADVNIDNIKGRQHYTFAMNTTVGPFDDPNVRLALKYGIDRDVVLQKILKGYGEIGNDNPISPSYRYFSGELEQRRYDPDKARHYLKKAGLSSLPVRLSASDAVFNGAINAALLFRDSCMKAGIDVTLVREPNDGYWSNVWLKKPFVMGYWYGRETEDQIFTTVYAKGAPWNETFWSDDKFEKLLEEARRETEDAKRAAIYAEMQSIVRNEGGAVIPAFANFVNASRKTLAHGEIASNRDLDGMRLPERWWFA